MESARVVTRVKEWLLRLPLMAKVMGITISMAVLIAGGLIWHLHHSYLGLEIDEVEGDARLIAKVLASGLIPLMHEANRDGVPRLLEDTARSIPSIRSIEVWDEAGRLVGRTSRAGLASRRVLEAGAPLAEGGRVRVCLDDSHVEFEMGWHTRRLITTTALAGSLGLLATWGLMRLVTRPVRALVEVTRAVKAGDYQARAVVETRDEVGELATAFNDMMAGLQKKDAINHQLLRKLMAAEEEERKRVARELHDQTGQSLTSLIASLAAMRNGERAKEFDDLLALATQTLGEVHALSRTLRPSVLDELGLMPALRRLAGGLAKRHGFKADVGVVGMQEETRLPRDLEVTLYRIVQEALTNAVRHGRARGVEVMLQRKAQSVLAVVEDDGQGFEATDWRALCLRTDHLGLLGMEERAALLGGTLRIESRPGNGTSLFVEIPLLGGSDA
jgi:signal transduction histidine kinase